MKPQILFVDDEAPTRELVSLLFRKKGYPVSTAMTAAEARLLLETNTFGAVILDIDLAGENGMDLLSYCKSAFPKLPVILFTGMGFEESLLTEARARGADGCMSKTQPLGELLAEVQRFLPGEQPLPSNT